MDILRKLGRKKYVRISRKEEHNVLYDWHKLRNPFRVMYNSFLIHLARILPLKPKNTILRLTGMRIGKNVGIAPGTVFDPFFPDLIEIDDNVVIGLDVKVLTHEMTNDYIRIGRVKLGKDSVVGAFSLLRSGVDIGENSVVAMNSYVNKDIPEGTVCAGVPARKIRK
ncbi:MAG: acyltransferase [Nanobdellota archaeon]